MSAQPKHSYTNDKAEQFARWRRRDHANLEALQNLVIAEIARRAAAAFMRQNPDADAPPSFEMPPHVRHLVSAIQGAHGGGVVAFEEFQRDYVTLGRQLQFTGSDETVRARVRHWLNDLIAWQYRVGVKLFTIQKGGEAIGQRPDGSIIRKKTTFIDHLKPPTDAGMLRARDTAEWKRHPGKALDAQAASVADQLPEAGTPEEAGEAQHGGESKPLPLSEYTTKAVAWFERSAEGRAHKIEERGGDGVEFVRAVADNLYRLASSMQKTEKARRDDAALSVFDDDPDTRPDRSALSVLAEVQAAPPRTSTTNKDPRSATTYRGDAEDAALRDTEITQEADPDATSRLAWALFWAVEQGIPVFPLYGVEDGICACPCTPKCKGDDGHKCGSECKAKGKHPLAEIAPQGFQNATTDPDLIRAWWAKYPFANIGLATGARSRLHVLDIDPRHDGDASLRDLVEVFGSEWIETRAVRTGSGGFHFFFIQPDELDLRNTTGKLAPGIDSRGTGGYVVAAGSRHESGAFYEVLDTQLPKPMPAWLIERLTATPDKPAERVVDFQTKRPRAVSSGRIFPDGERNSGLFGVGIGRWRHGWAADVTELHAQLSELNAARCSPPLDGAEVAAMAAHIARDYAHLRGIDKGRQML